MEKRSDMKYDDATGEFVQARDVGEGRAGPEAVQPSALTVRALRMPKIKGRTPGERINFLHQLSVASGKLSVAAAVMAGWELHRAREACAHGQWLAWLARNVSFARSTADNYMRLYAATVGAARAAAPLPVALTVEPTAAELEAAAHDVDGKSLSSLYKSTRLMAAPGGWGGAREGAGRKPQDVAAELDAAAALEPALWAAARGALDALLSLDAERALFSRLSTLHLYDAAGLLADLWGRARTSLARRQEGGGE